jgi:hypothetical protein
MPPGAPSNLSVGKVVTGTNPAANTEWSVTVPLGKWWLLLSVSVQLVQGATQTPQPLLTITDGVTTFFEGFGASAAQSSATTQRYNWAGDMTMTVAGTTPNIHSTAPLPENLMLLPGYVIASTTLGIGANTDYGAPALYVIEYG